MAACSTCILKLEMAAYQLRQALEHSAGDLPPDLDGYRVARELDAIAKAFREARERQGFRD